VLRRFTASCTHSVIVELNYPATRLEQAGNNGQGLGKEPADELDPDENVVEN